MATSYELWDVETGNCVGLYADEAAALAAVRATLREDGAGAVETLALARRAARRPA